MSYQFNSNTLTPTKYTEANRTTQPNNLKFKIFLISIISVMVIGLVILIILITNKNNTQPVTTRENTPTLQIYAELPDEMPISDIEKTIKKIDSSAEVTLDEGYGMIKIPNTNEYISFFYLYQDNENEIIEEDEESEDIEDESYDDSDESDEENEITEIIYQPDIAYDFTYVYDLGEDGLYISRVTNNLYQSYNGEEVFDFTTKEEAIEAYLSLPAE